MIGKGEREKQRGRKKGREGERRRKGECKVCNQETRCAATVIALLVTHAVTMDLPHHIFK